MWLQVPHRSHTQAGWGGEVTSFHKEGGGEVLRDDVGLKKGMVHYMTNHLDPEFCFKKEKNLLGKGMACSRTPNIGSAI